MTPTEQTATSAQAGQRTGSIKTGAMLAVLGALLGILGFAATIQASPSGGYVMITGAVLLVGGLILNEIAALARR